MTPMHSPSTRCTPDLSDPQVWTASTVAHAVPAASTSTAVTKPIRLRLRRLRPALVSGGSKVLSIVPVTRSSFANDHPTRGPRTWSGHRQSHHSACL